ncbi:MAG: glycosyltransferase family 4 protein [Clostridia bacterium]|nr:glycosyltransferase family 4 protein [Clostridia bacterium]
MKERCLLVSSFMAEYKGCYINNLIVLINKFHANGDEITLIFPKAKSRASWLGELTALGCKVYLLEYKPYSLDNIKFIRKIVKEEKINLIYSDFTGWDNTVKFAKPFMPAIWHERMRVNDKDTAKKLYNLFKYRIIGGIKTYPVGISDDVYETVNRLAGRNRSYKIYNAVSVDRFDMTLPRKENEIKKYLMFSYTPFVKGVDIAFDAFERLNQDEIKAKLVVVSHGACDDYIKERYPALPQWLEVKKPREDVEHYYFECDTFISASRSEGFSMALMESLYTGMSAIVSDIPGTSWSQNFKGTSFFESGNSEALLNAVKENLNGKISVQDIAFNQKKIIDEYSPDRWADNVIELHKKVLKG